MAMTLPSTYDIVATELPPTMVGEACCTHLTTKGFCVIDSGLTAEQCEKASADIVEMESMGKFAIPPELVSNGLFGQEGSNRIAEMDAPGELSTDGDALQSVDQLMTTVSDNLCDFLDGFNGLDCRTRTYGLVHETNAELEQPSPMQEREASAWLNTFVRAKVLIVVCLGPTNGVLLLQPFEDEEAQVVEVPTSPGTMIVLRTDLMFHRHSAHQKVHLMTCHLLEPRHHDKRSAHNAARRMTPVARAIDNWCLEKLQLIKSEQEFGQELGEMPIDFKQAINQVCFKGQRAAIRGAASKLPAQWDYDKMFGGMTAGVDLVVEIGIKKWNQDWFYNEDPEEWRHGKHAVRHMGCVEGMELFDNKKFGLSPAEASSMDPHQTSVLEVGYEALFTMGLDKKKINNTVGGVYLGCTNSEWAYVPKELTAAGATGGAASITSNRFSFCMGMKGPSVSIDSDAASGLMCVHLGTEGIADKGRGVMNAYSLAGGIHYNLYPSWWPQLQAGGLFCYKGRCFCFDESADGHIRSDAIVMFAINRLIDTVDGQAVLKTDGHLVGILAGSFANQSGSSCSYFAAPSAKADQEMISCALKNSCINELDVEAVEANADGTYLSDAIEVSALSRGYRSHEDSWDTMLALSAHKSNFANTVHAAGAVSFLKILLQTSKGLSLPNIHLHALNPHMDFGDLATPSSELVEPRRTVSYTGCTSKGFGGTNVHSIVWGRSQEFLPENQKPIMNRESINYWPGGGGQLEDEDQPYRPSGYHIAGTWNRWLPEQMEMEGGNSFGYTLTLGENRWEKFQIWLDGNPERKLFPSTPNAAKGSQVLGPLDDAEGMKWAIDGRPWSQTTEEPETPSSEALAEQDPVSIDCGRIGDKYRIHLRIAGKYRTITWEKLPKTTPEEGEGALVERVPEGTYAVMASWNGWKMEEMFRDDSDPGMNYVEVELKFANGGQFAIVRNEDMEQMFYPDAYDGDDTAAVLGPDELGQDLYWHLDGKAGDTFRIEFQRKPEFGLDRKKVTWKKVS